MSGNPYAVVSTLSALIDLYWADPVAFAKDMLGFDPDDWQRAAITDSAEHPRVSIRSGQGGGKTGLEASLVIWFLCCRPNPRIDCTAPTRQQLHDVLWAEVAKWLERSMVKNLLRWTKTKVYMIGHEKRWFATARTATKQMPVLIQKIERKRQEFSDSWHLMCRRVLAMISQAEKVKIYAITQK